MPGIGVRTAARILLEIGDASNFASSGHLAAYAGIAPVTHSSGSSIKGEHPARTGNRKLCECVGQRFRSGPLPGSVAGDTTWLTQTLAASACPSFDLPAVVAGTDLAHGLA